MQYFLMSHYCLFRLVHWIWPIVCFLLKQNQYLGNECKHMSVSQKIIIKGRSIQSLVVLKFENGVNIEFFFSNFPKENIHSNVLLKIYCRFKSLDTEIYLNKWFTCTSNFSYVSNEE